MQFFGSTGHATVGSFGLHPGGIGGGGLHPSTREVDRRAMPRPTSGEIAMRPSENVGRAVTRADRSLRDAAVMPDEIWGWNAA